MIKCGTPTDRAPIKTPIHQAEAEPVKSVPSQQMIATASIGYILSAISCIVGIIFGAFLYIYPSAVALLFLLSSFTVFPALMSLAIGIYCLYMNVLIKNAAVRVRSIIGIILSAIILVFLFVTFCIFVAV